MIRSLRQRFIIGAMSAFIILIILLILGTSGIGYLYMQYEKNEFLNEALSLDYPGRGMAEVIDTYISLEDSHHSHGKSPAASHCLIDYDNQGNMVGYYSNGMRTLKPDLLKNYVQKIRANGTLNGEVDGYIYRIRTDDAGMRIVIMDFCLQEHTYRSMLNAVIYLSLACTLLLLALLVPISKRVALSYAAHAEKQRQFITNAGHDLKTPVAIIRSNIEAHELINGENKWSRNAREQTVRLNQLIEQMLFLARMEEGSMRTPMARLDFAALLSCELQNYQEMLDSRRLQISADIPASLMLRGSRESLLQLVHILLNNAVKYSSAGGSLNIVLRRKLLRMQLIMENSVDALPDCPANKLFERFFRPDIARTQKTGGSGIGLAAAQDIARLHRGKIEALYGEGPSISFVVDLPLR